MRWILQALNLTNLSFFLSPLRCYCWNLTLQDSTVKSHCRIQKQHSEPFVTIKWSLPSEWWGGESGSRGKRILVNISEWDLSTLSWRESVWCSMKHPGDHIYLIGSGWGREPIKWDDSSKAPGCAWLEQWWSFRLLPVLWEAYSMLPDPALQQETTCGWWLASTPANASASQRRWDPYSLMQ